MKKIVLTLFVAAAALSVNAQEIPQRENSFKPHHKEGPMHGKKEMAALNLSDDQKAKMKTLNEQHRKDMEALAKQDNITVKEAREKREALQKDHRAKFESILTADQKAQIEKNKADRQEKMKEFGKKHEGKMKADLNLTDEQSAKLAANRKAMGGKMKAIRDNSSLTEEQKKEQFQQLRKEQKESMKSILTDEQQKKMEEARKQYKGKRGDRKNEKKQTESMSSES